MQVVTQNQSEDNFKRAFQDVFHALGRFDEHTREDRDMYVKVLLDNIEPGEQI